MQENFCPSPKSSTLSEQVISPVKPVADRKYDRGLCPNAVHWWVHVVFLRTAEFQYLFFSPLHPLASIHSHIVGPWTRRSLSAFRQPVKAPVVRFAAAAPCRGQTAGRAEVIVLIGVGSLSTTPDNADEERAQRGETGGCYRN